MAGQAKLKGSYEQRKAAAIALAEQERLAKRRMDVELQTASSVKHPSRTHRITEEAYGELIDRELEVEPRRSPTAFRSKRNASATAMMIMAAMGGLSNR